MKKIAFIVHENLYQTKRYFTGRLAEAFERKGVKTWILDVPEKALNAESLSLLRSFDPDLTASFSALQPISEGKQLWDLLQIPHWSILLDPAFYSAQLINNPLVILSCADCSDVAYLKSAGFQRTFFFPHAVERELEEGKGERPLEVVFLGSCFDYESLRASWKQQNPQPVVRVLDDAIERVYAGQSLAEALAGAWEVSREDPRRVDFQALFYYLDIFVRGQDRVELIRSIKDVPVHIFGELSRDNAVGILGWRQYIGKQSNVTLNPSVTYEKALEVMQQAKIILCSLPFCKEGTDERILAGFASGALPISTKNSYLRERFGDSLLTYTPKNRAAVATQIQEMLANESLRHEKVAKGRKTVLESDTWDHRADLAMQQLKDLI